MGTAVPDRGGGASLPLVLRASAAEASAFAEEGAMLPNLAALAAIRSCIHIFVWFFGIKVEFRGGKSSQELPKALSFHSLSLFSLSAQTTTNQTTTTTSKISPSPRRQRGRCR